MVADTTESRTEDEGEERPEGLLVGYVKGCVVLRGAYEELCELDGVASLETAPEKDGGGDGIAVNMYVQWEVRYAGKEAKGRT